MSSPPLRVTRRPEHLLSDDKRVILRYLDFVRGARIRKIAKRVLRIPADEVQRDLRKIRQSFATRHRDLNSAFDASYCQVARHLGDGEDLSEERRQLIGAYFTMEYSIESAALFNPSIVPHPDQDNLPTGAVRFLLSLRATGEGHVSSIVFRRGVIHATGEIDFDDPPRYAYTARPSVDRTVDVEPYRRRLHAHGLADEQVSKVLARLPDPFTVPQLRESLRTLRRTGGVGTGLKRLSVYMLWEAQANYQLRFPADGAPSEIVIFPATPYEAHGMEDVRMVRFTGDDARVRYFGTYTAYDGYSTAPMLLETDDFRRFHIATLGGRYARNKGLALFPRKIDGQYAMLARHDGENLHLLRSRDVRVWNDSIRLQAPRERWELVQLGNCGAPLETDAGWLVLTHGVGPVRQYCIGALLLDRRDPSRVLGRLREPLLVPTAREREGYVPNVVYSCGSIIHRGQVVIPYAMSDARTAFATVPVASLIHRLRAEGP